MLDAWGKLTTPCSLIADSYHTELAVAQSGFDGALFMGVGDEEV